MNGNWFRENHQNNFVWSHWRIELTAELQWKFYWNVELKRYWTRKPIDNWKQSNLIRSDLNFNKKKLRERKFFSSKFSSRDSAQSNFRQSKISIRSINEKNGATQEARLSFSVKVSNCWLRKVSRAQLRRRPDQDQPPFLNERPSAWEPDALDEQRILIRELIPSSGNRYRWEQPVMNELSGRAPERIESIEEERETEKEKKNLN